MSLIQLSLEKTLFYLSILKFGDTEISNLSLKGISLSIYGTIIEYLDKEVMISDLEQRVNSLLQDHQYRDEFTFGFTREEFENINPKYYGKTINYSLQRNGNEVSLIGIKY